MTTKFNMVRDINGYNGFGLQPPDNAWQMELAANVEQHFTVPSNFHRWLAIFSYQPGADVWVDCSGHTAQVPAGAVATTTSELNPSARAISNGTVLSLITDDVTAEVGVALYALE